MYNTSSCYILLSENFWSVGKNSGKSKIVVVEKSTFKCTFKCNMYVHTIIWKSSNLAQRNVGVTQIWLPKWFYIKGLLWKTETKYFIDFKKGLNYTEMIKEVHFRKKWNQIGKNITFTNYFNLDCPLANKKSLLSHSSEIKGLYLMKLSIVKHI